MSNVLHDARTGFHDIKGLHTPVNDYPFITGYIIYSAIIALCLFYLYKLIRKYVFPEKVLSPYEKSMQKLDKCIDDLAKQKISPRAYASNTSLVLRDYLGDSYEFNATELTNQEVIDKLIASSKNLSVDSRKQLCLSTNKILKLLEKNTFADEVTFNVEEFVALHKETINVINYSENSLKENGSKVQ